MRQPKPFYRKFTKSWYVTIQGRQIPLGSDEKTAWKKYHLLMASKEKLLSSSLKVATLFDAYLDWLKAHRSEGTYVKVCHYLSDFSRHIGKSMRVSSLEGNHVSSWVTAHPKWSSTSGHDAVSIVQRAFNWAVKHRHLPSSPVQYVPDKPRKRRRETVFSQSDWRELRSLVKDQEFGDLLDFMWETGCRPQEARAIEARHVNLDHGVVVFPPSESKGEEESRVVFLTDKAADICRRCMHENPTEAILRNKHGRPWTKNAIGSRFTRLRKKLKRPANAYAIRHSYATEALLNGCDSLILADLMGHKDRAMIARIYGHLARNPRYLSEQAKKIRPSDA